MRKVQVRFLSTSISSCAVTQLVNAHGLPSESASYLSTKLNISGVCTLNKLNPDRLKLQKCDSVFNLLKVYGFTGLQIAEIIQKRPSLLRSQIAALERKLKLLRERSESTGRSLSSLVMSDPSVLMLVKQPGPESKEGINRLVELYELPMETANSVFDKLSFDGVTRKNFDSVLEVLKGYGLSGIRIARLVAKRPTFFRIKVETLEPKLRFLKEKGFTGDTLADLIENNSSILIRALGNQLEVAWDILKQCFGNDDTVVEIVKRARRFLTSDLKKTAEPNIMMLREEGVPQANILKLVMLQPWVMLEKSERMAYAIRTVKELGRQPSSLMFIHTLRPVVSVDEETWVKKIDFFKNLGLTDKEIRHMLIHYPLCFSTSNEKIKASWDFFVNEANYDRSFIIGYPKYLMYGLDKRIRPRFKVFKILKSLGLVKEKTRFSFIVNRSEKEFNERYILPFVENVPNLLDIYRGSVSANKDFPI